ASRQWNKRFDDEIKRFGFTQNRDEPCVYIKPSRSNIIFLILYVDDILLMGNSIPMLQSVKTYLGKCFAIKDLGEAAYILGIKIYRDRSKRLIGLCASTPAEMKHMQNVPYASAVGSIMYAVKVVGAVWCRGLQRWGYGDHGFWREIRRRSTMYLKRVTGKKFVACTPLVLETVYSPPQSIPQLEYPLAVNLQPQQTEFPQLDPGLSVPVFKQGDDPIDAINHMMSFLSAVVTSRYPATNNQLRNSSNPRQQATINDGRVTLQPV
nr:hypothetical protein [Tanacetum cinerariifolium]